MNNLAKNYTCPMHPEFLSGTAGHCPKCGMALVFVQKISTTSKPDFENTGLGTLTWKNYIPLIVIFLLLIAITVIVSWNDHRAGGISLAKTLSYFMAGFFTVFAGFKIMDLKGFAEGYATYDLLAQKIFVYGYIYPFIELAFGLFMVAGVHTGMLLWIECTLMVFSGLGVAIKLAKREPFICACLGTFLKVPLTSITLIEDFGMALLALVFIFFLS